MEALVRTGPASLDAVAGLTGLAAPAVAGIVEAFARQGWVRETAVGRSAAAYELVGDAACIVAVDLGGTKVRVALADLACRILAEETAPTDPRGAGFVVGQIASLAFRAADRHGVSRRKLRLAAIGVPGSPDPASGRVLFAPNIPGFGAMDVVSAFAEAFGFGAFVENDVNLAAYGEHRLGKGRGIDDLAFVALGTGIGSGLIVGGRLLRGAGNAAGEICFVPVGADPFDPETLRTGALERVVATHAMIDRFEALSGRRVGVPAIFDHAAAGDRAAVAVLDETARYLAQGILAVAAIVNPRMVVLGGSIGLRPEIVSRVRSLLPSCFPYELAVEASALGPRAAVLGAAAFGLDRLDEALFGDDASAAVHPHPAEADPRHGPLP